MRTKSREGTRPVEPLVSRGGGRLVAAAHRVEEAVAALLRGRRARIALAATVALLALFFATTHTHIKGRWYGLYLLKSKSGRPFELKDDLRLGDGPRVIGGFGFGGLREALGSDPVGLPRLALDWDDEEGGGIVTSMLPGGELLQTYFGRYVDSNGASPQGLFVGGAIPDVAEQPRQNQSGMAFHDESGWHHIWCNVNEILVVGPERRVLSPGEWTFKGSQVLAVAPERVVLSSAHEVEVGRASLRMERYAYFKAGRRYFRLGINVVNVGEEPVVLSYGYGDEPWVGEFGTAAGNVGWTSKGIVPVVAAIDPVAESWAGILDSKSGVANYLGWAGATPDAAYFGNHPGTPKRSEYGEVLASNEVFIGLEWRDRVIEPGETFSLRLTIGMAVPGPGGVPTFPAGALTPR